MTNPKIAGGRLVRKEKSPDILDALIVGAGPTGSAVAFALNEAERRVLVVDYSSILARARDGAGPFLTHLPPLRWPPAQAGKVMRALLNSEAQGSAPDPTAWQRAYAGLGIPFRIGVEVTRFEKITNGGYKVLLWKREEGSEEEVHARKIVLAVGCGRPSDSPIVGDTNALKSHFEGAQHYIGRTVCVIGGDGAAIEAAIAISQAKAAAADDTPVIWSGAGSKLPTLPKASKEAFFQAYVERGNLVFYPNGKAVAIFRGQNGQPCLSIRFETHPHLGLQQTRHLEFPLSDCLVLNQGDRPIQWLSELGLNLHNEDSRCSVPLVDNSFETNLPGVFLAGSVLSPVYYQSRGEGNSREMHFKDDLGNVVSSALTVVRRILEEASVEAPAAEILRKVVAARESRLKPVLKGPQLVRLRPDGSRAEYYPIQTRIMTIGRKGTNVTFPEDDVMSEKHASVFRRAGGFILRDEASAMGVFLKLPAGRKVPIQKGDLLRLGGQFLVFGVEDKECWAHHFDHNGKEGQRYALSQKPLIFGQINLAVDDEQLAGRHLAVSLNESGAIQARDLKSTTGSFMRVMREVPIKEGDMFLLGRECLQLVEDPQAKPEAPQEARIPTEAKGPAWVTIEGLGGPYPAKPGQSLSEIASEHQLDLGSECRAGACGSDPVRIISGHQNVGTLDEMETETLREICQVRPGNCRLACKLRIYGAVRVKLL